MQGIEAHGSGYPLDGFVRPSEIGQQFAHVCGDVGVIGVESDCVGIVDFGLVKPFEVKTRKAECKLAPTILVVTNDSPSCQFVSFGQAIS